MPRVPGRLPRTVRAVPETGCALNTRHSLRSTAQALPASCRHLVALAAVCTFIRLSAQCCSLLEELTGLGCLAGRSPHLLGLLQSRSPRLFTKCVPAKPPAEMERSMTVPVQGIPAKRKDHALPGEQLPEYLQTVTAPCKVRVRMGVQG